MGDPCSLTPNSAFKPAFQRAYSDTIHRIETDLKNGRIPDFDGEIARLQSTVLTGSLADSGRLAALSDYRSIVTGQCTTPTDHPNIRFAVAASEGSTTDITITVTEKKGRPSVHTIHGAIDASRLSDADRDRLESDPNYTSRRIGETNYFIPVQRHPVARARSLLATAR